jgi:antitoxin (DNA-binding transcriptional repressor) of toxin-antitoxin stability system
MSGLHSGLFCYAEGLIMSSIPIDEASRRLPELLHQLQPGDELIITEGDQPLARVVAAERATTERREPGTLRGTVLHMADDFDEPLDDFQEYMS